MTRKLTGRLQTGHGPFLALGVAVLAGSTGAIFVRVTEAPSIIDAFYRLLFTTLLLLPVTVANYREDIVTISVRDLGIVLVTGVLLAVHFGAWMESLNWTSVAASSVIVQTQVVFVALGSVLLLDEEISPGKTVGIAIAFAGVTTMSVSGVIAGEQSLYAGPNPTYGNLLALLGAVGFAAYLLAGRSVRQRLHLFPYVTIVYAVASGVLFVGALLSTSPVAPGAYPVDELLLFLGMAVVPGVFGHTVMNWSLKYVESNVVSVVFLGAPLGNTVLALLLLGEIPGLATVGGGLVVLLGIYQTTRVRERSDA